MPNSVRPGGFEPPTLCSEDRCSYSAELRAPDRICEFFFVIQFTNGLVTRVYSVPEYSEYRSNYRNNFTMFIISNLIEKDVCLHH